MTKDWETPKTALVFAAHPDDAEFGAGSTLWQWGQEGCRVDIVVATDGSQGSGDQARDPRELIALRRAEQEAAAKVLGANSCIFLGFPDGQLCADESLVSRLVQVIRKRQPQCVFTHTPESLDHRPFHRAQGAWVNHPDHRALSQACLDAVYPFARNPNSFPELGPPHKVETLWLWGSRFPNREVESSQGLEKKAQALACHRSQFSQDTNWGHLKSLWSSTEKFEVVEL